MALDISRRGVANTAMEIVANFALPYLIYVETEGRFGQAHALMLATLPPILWSLIEFARKRRVDAVSILVIAGIALSLLAFLGGGSVRWLQLRESLVTGLIGLVFLGSAAIGRPLIYQVALASKRRESTAEAERFEGLRVHAGFRRFMTQMTVVWGLGMVVQTAIACVLVFSISIRMYLIVSPIFSYGTLGALGLWTYFAVKRRKRAAAAAATVTTSIPG